MASAAGDLQILPMHTNKILFLFITKIIVKPINSLKSKNTKKSSELLYYNLSQIIGMQEILNLIEGER
jgi:hypothetical protein